MADKPNPGIELIAMAADRGVSICQACDIAGIARSTPSRWKQGSVPRAMQAAKMRNAIIHLSSKDGVGIKIAMPVEVPAREVVMLEEILERLKRIEAAILSKPGIASIVGIVWNIAA